MKRLAIPLLAGATLALAACGSEPAPEAAQTEEAAPEPTGPGPIAAVAGENDDLSTFLEAVRSAMLGGSLIADGPYTVFAPTNAAFEKLPAGKLDKLMTPDEQDDLGELINAHIVKGAFGSDALAKAIEDGDGKAELETVEGDTITASKDGDTITLTDEDGHKAKLTDEGAEASNGVLYTIDTVLAD
ncbi:fasciclin domain-containing protein [Altericroceibacterium spongiae]|nr:fasciclin domain-containing protein [Altericroceibacterium spongiae]